MAFRSNIILALTFVLLSATAQVTQVETVIQKGHDQSVLCLALHPDSTLLATGSRDKSIKLWNLNNTREIRNLLGHTASVRSIAFSPDGKTLASCANDETFRLWNIQTGETLYRSEPMGDLLTSVAFLADGKHLLIGGYPWEAFVFNIQEKKIIRKIKVSPNKGTGSGVQVAVSGNGEWFSIAEDNHTAQVFDAKSFELKYTLKREDGYCGGCPSYSVFSPDSKFLYLASHSGALKKYDLATGHLYKSLVPELRDIQGMAISPDGSTLLLIHEREASLYDAERGSLLKTFATEEKAKFNRGLFSFQNDRVIFVKENNLAEARTLNDTPHSVFTGILNERDKGGVTYDPNFYWESHIARYIRIKNELKIAPDGKSLIRGKFGTKLKQWDMASGQQVHEFIGHDKAPYCFDFSNDGKLMVSSGADGKVVLWDLVSGDSLRSWKAHREPVFDIRFSPDGKKILTSSWDATIKIFDANTGKQLQYIDLQNNSGFVAAWHQNNLYFFVARLNKTLEMWEPDTKSVVRSFVGHTDGVSSIQQSKDGQRLLSASWDGTVRLWNIATGLSIMKLSSHEGNVHTAIFSNNEQFIFSAGADRTINVWNAANGNLLYQLTGHQADVTSLAISKDDKTLISHSLDGITKFWDLENKKEFYEHIHLAERDWMVKTRDGYFSITANARDKIHFVSGLTTFDVEQFFETFFRPDLLPSLYKNRGAGTPQKTLQGKLQSSPPPDVRVAVLPAADGKRAEVFVRITERGGGIDEVKLLHNGKSIALSKPPERKKYKKDEQVIVKEEIALVGGENTFSASAFNLDRVESATHSMSVVAEVPMKPGTCHLFVVGINKYKNSKLELNYARPDAESFKKVLMKNTKGIFKSLEVHALYDEDASKANILQTLDKLAAQVKPEDVFIFYYAGHGSMADNRFFFIPSESIRLYDIKSLEKEAIPASMLQEKFRNIAALKQMIIMDACQSGGSVELLATRGAAEEKAIAQLSRSAGIHVLASAGSEQFATEFAELGHGLFTYVLIKALQGAADGAPLDGKVTIYELKSYLDDQVPEMTRQLKGKPQYPFTFSRGQDFPVILKED